jgi:glycosyltransferase involved in cell wall biosynthesis
MEILLVDNGSTDDTLRVAEEFARCEPSRIRALAEREIRSSYAARNRAVAVANGEIICFIDADMTVPPGYLSAVERRFEDPTCRYLGCEVEVEAAEPTIAADIDRILGFPVEGYLTQLHYAPTCCLSVRASLLAEVGPFDATLESGGDQEFGRRVHERGVRQDLLVGIRLRHPARARFGELVRKRRRVARGHAHLVQRHPEWFAVLARSYLWRRLVRTITPAEFRRRARARSVALGRGRSILLGAVHLWLKAIGTYEYRRVRRKLRSEAKKRGESRP